MLLPDLRSKLSVSLSANTVESENEGCNDAVLNMATSLANGSASLLAARPELLLIVLLLLVLLLEIVLVKMIWGCGEGVDEALVIGGELRSELR